MERLRGKELKSNPVVEETAVTFKMIKDILVEEGRPDLVPQEKAPDAPALMPAAPASAQPAPDPRFDELAPCEPALARPPSAAHLATMSDAPDTTPAPDRGRRSLLSRLFGKG